MATLTKRVSEDATGEFFVNEQCIDCDLCRQTAPTVFSRKMNGIAGITYVRRQPENEHEQSLCMEALRACPVEAIGLFQMATALA
jgi:ferredoxin